MIIRTASPKDEKIINDLLEASFSQLLSPDYHADILSTVLPNLTKINPNLLECGTYYLAFSKNGDLLGCGGWTRERPGTTEITKGLGHMRHFAVHPDHIGKGVGQRLFDFCKSRALNKDIHELECYSTLNAEQFYRSCGFKKTNEFDLDMGKNITMPSIIMKMSI